MRVALIGTRGVPATYSGFEHLEPLSHTALSALRLPRGTAIVCMGVGNAPPVRLLELRGHRTVFNVDGADWQ